MSTEPKDNKDLQDGDVVEVPEVPAVAENPPIEDKDEFADAFAELTASAKEEPAAETPPPETPPAEEPPAEPTPAEEPLVEGQGDLFAQELAKLREELTAPPAEEPTAKENAPTATFTEAETAFLKQYEEDWPDISKAETLKRKAEMTDAIRFMFAEITRTYAPLVEYYKNSSYSSHESAIRDAHEDYDEVRPEVIKWVEGRPPTMRKAFTEIVEQGTAEDIIELVSVWKEATGKKAPGAIAPKLTETPVKATQAAQKLSVVSSKRTTMPAVADPNDFDGAFAEFSKAKS